MKARELRIGNLVNHIRKGVVVVGIMELDFIDKGVLDVESIPLTEEWLIKFGLNKTVDHPGRKLYEHDDIIPLWFSDKRGITDFYASRVRIRECKYVHQLQNLYFALTGEELTIKE